MGTNKELQEILVVVKEIKARMEDLTQILTDKLLIIENMLKCDHFDQQCDKLATELKTTKQAKVAELQAKPAVTKLPQTTKLEVLCNECASQGIESPLYIAERQTKEGKTFLAWACANYKKHPTKFPKPLAQDGKPLKATEELRKQVNQ